MLLGSEVFSVQRFRRLALEVLFVFVVLLALSLCACREGPPNEVHSIEDVSGKNIGVLSGTPSARLAEELGSARLFFSGEELINGLLLGSVDCVLMEAVIAGEHTAGKSGVKTLGETLLEHELRFAVPRENAQLLFNVNSALSALESNGTLKSLRDKYINGKSYTYNSPKNIEQRPGTLRLAIHPDSPPYSFVDGDGEYSGLDVEVALAVCDYLGVELSVVPVDSGELVTAVWFGRADIAAGWLPSDVQEQVHITEPYAQTAYVIIVRK